MVKCGNIETIFNVKHYNMDFLKASYIGGFYMWKITGCIEMIYLISCTVLHVFHDVRSFCFSIKQFRKSTLRVTILVYYFCLITSKYIRLTRINISDK
jgi:hypothetical protein